MNHVYVNMSLQVLFKTPVSITEHPKINEWLTLVEREMRVTLAKLLAESVTEVGAFNKGTGIDLSTYIHWIDQYQVTTFLKTVFCLSGTEPVYH